MPLLPEVQFKFLKLENSKKAITPLTSRGYYAVPTGYKYLQKFIWRLKRKWFKILRRRSQKDRFAWERLERLTKAKWVPVKILHPWPDMRFAVKHLR